MTMVTLSFIPGGVAAPKGFTASGIHCGIRRNKSKRDLALIAADILCNAAAVYTQNLVCGAPVTVTKKHLAAGKARAVVCNSGIANTCNADGIEKAEGMCEITAKALGIAPGEVIVASTGVIGQPLDLDPVKSGMPQLVNELSKDGSGNAAQAIMTTDTRKKEFALTFTLGGKECTIGAISKGSGMIHPNMATMLCFITTDAAVSAPMLQKALTAAVADSFNMLSIDGDTSTNDMACILASGKAGNREIATEGESFTLFTQMLSTLLIRIAREMARDGEGATKLVVCEVSGAKDQDTARTVAKSVICSSLVKTAMFGADANWGRVLCAMGYAGAEIDITKADVSFASPAGRVEVCQNGAGIPFSEERAKQVLLEEEIKIDVRLHDGEACAEAFGCDLTYDYVKINGDYRT
uniref:bifunctional glutamate N-acetyltransferase/amino-acid acetyltransferase ArgJ n=1 Tax=Candidatus Fimivicinus sp. TaxID=3056640 RepID=UPI003FEFB566